MHQSPPHLMYEVTVLSAFYWLNKKLCLNQRQYNTVSRPKSLYDYKSCGEVFLLVQCTTCTLQVNLCQKLSFLNQLTQNMTRDCSLNSPKNTSSEHVVYKYCFECQNKNKIAIFLQNMFWTCILQGIQWTISCHIVG